MDAVNALALRLDPDDIEETPSYSLSSHLRQAQRQLKTFRQEAKKL